MTVDEFIDRLLLLYGPPDSPNDEAFIEEYRAMLDKVDARLLKPASDQIVATHTRRGWPTPAEVHIAVKKGSTIVFGSYMPPEHRRFKPEGEMTDEEKERHEASKARVDLLAKSVIKAMRAGQVAEVRETINSDRSVFESMQSNSRNRFHRGY